MSLIKVFRIVGILLLVSYLYNKYYLENKFITILNTKDNNTPSYKGNVIQGIAYFDDLWITSQTYKDKFLVINFLDKNGHSIFNNRINYESHGQDLSIEYNNKNGILKLYTTSKNWKGIVEFRYKYSKDKIIYLKKYSEINLRCNHCTPSIDENKKYFIVKDKKYITIYNKNLIKDNVNKAIVSKFMLHIEQLKKEQWFQGIAMKDNLIYCLTGDNKIKNNKLLYIYDIEGNIKNKLILDFGIFYSYLENNKYELEGLTFKRNSLYTTFNTGKNGKNTKRLYKILEL